MLSLSRSECYYFQLLPKIHMYVNIHISESLRVFHSGILKLKTVFFCNTTHD